MKHSILFVNFFCVSQVVFHTATLMPSKETDQSCNNKKRHIGNDYVTIVFNESGEDYNMQRIKVNNNTYVSLSNIFHFAQLMLLYT
jgi:hypothetical protein